VLLQVKHNHNFKTSSIRSVVSEPSNVDVFTTQLKKCYNSHLCTQLLFPGPKWGQRCGTAGNDKKLVLLGHTSLHAWNNFFWSSQPTGVYVDIMSMQDVGGTSAWHHQDLMKMSNAWRGQILFSEMHSLKLWAQESVFSKCFLQCGASRWHCCVFH